MTNRKNRYFDREDQFRSIILSNDIDNESVEEMIQFILDVNEYDDEQDSVSKDFERKPIKLIINSFGGVIYDGFALIGVIKTSKTPIHTYCYGYAMSMGLPIFACGWKRIASKYATFMYHEALNSYPQFDKLSIIKDDLDESNRVMKQYDEILLLNSTISQKQLDDVKKSRRDWYFTAEEALKYGMVDEIE
jgi:ATP-dependent Clp protease protease subunit